MKITQLELSALSYVRLCVRAHVCEYVCVCIELAIESFHLHRHKQLMLLPGNIPHNISCQLAESSLPQLSSN